MGKSCKIQRAVFAAIGLLALAMPGAGAATRDPDLPPPDPKGYWRKLTHDDATSTSKCIDKQVSPLCAVETDLACSLRGLDDMCQRARGVSRPPWLGAKAEPPYLWVKYRVVKSGRFKKGDPRLDDRLNDLAWEPGDVWIIVDARDCDGETWCAKPAPRIWRYWIDRYVLHKRGQDWIVVYFGEWHWRQ